ncbi:MAG: ABC transporter permease [Gemmataceae bacterium]|nr:ABC transporter permease [Gemmataceae bacterium]
MKFLAMLKDSLREAADATVLYVMLGLSALLILIGATMTFTPTPGAKAVMGLCAIPLSIDLEKIDLLEAGGNPMAVFQHVQGVYQVAEAGPVEGEPDLPGSTFRVVVERKADFMDLFGKGKKAKTLDEVREQFGRLDDVRLAEVVEAEEPSKGKFVLRVRLTADGRTYWPHSYSLFFGALPIYREGIPIGPLLFGLQAILVNTFGAWIALIVSLVMTAFFVPNMLRKGTVDLLLVKPISRPVLLFYKYVGGLLFIAINTAVAVGGFWLALSLRSGVWAPGTLLTIPAITFYFAILYSVSVLFAVLTRSAIVSIMMSCLVWVLLFALGVTVAFLDLMAYQARMQRTQGKVSLLGGFDGDPVPKGRRGPPPLVSADYEEGTFGSVVRAIHFVLPRTNDLNSWVGERMQRDLQAMPRVFRQAIRTEPVRLGESLLVSSCFIAAMLGLACWRFSTKDY